MEKQASKRKRNAIISILALSIGLILGLNVPEAKAGTLFYDDFESYEVGLHYPVCEYEPYIIGGCYFIIQGTGINNSKDLVAGTGIIVETSESFGNNNVKESIWIKLNQTPGCELWHFIYISGNSNKNITIYTTDSGLSFDGSDPIPYENNIVRGRWIKLEITLKDPHHYDYQVFDDEENLIYSKENNYIEEAASLKFKVSGMNGPVEYDNVKIEQVTNDDLIIRRFLGPKKNAILNKLKSIYYEVEYYNGDDYDKYYSFLAHFYDANTDEWVNTLLPAALKIVEPTNKQVVFVNYFQLIPDGFYLPPNKNYYVDMEVLRYDGIEKVWVDNYRYYSHAFEFSLVEGVPAPPQPTPSPAPEAPEIPTESEACALPENPTILNYVQTGICKAFYFLFIPNETQREDLSDGMEQAVGNITDQKPIGYIKQIYNTWKEVNVVEYEGEGKAPVEIPVIGTTIKNTIAILLWVVFAKYIVKRIGSITL